MVAHDKASVQFLNSPRRREAASCHLQTRGKAVGVTQTDGGTPEQRPRYSVGTILLSNLAQKLRQLADIRRNPPRYLFDKSYSSEMDWGQVSIFLPSRALRQSCFSWSVGGRRLKLWAVVVAGHF
jgi:hypothetical protein